MTWVLRSKPITQRVTKLLAQEFAEMEAAPHDRPLSERRLQVYERMFKEGAFRPVTWAKAYCRETKGWYRVNGKHTSTFLSGFSEKLPEFFVTIEEYDCDTLEDVAKLYATFDSKMQSRTANDIYNSFAAAMPELRVISARTVSLAVTGLSYHTWHGDAVKKSPAEKAELLFDNAGFALWLHELFNTGAYEGDRGNSVHIRRMPVVAAMVGTYSKVKGPATEFWTAVRDETDPTPIHPTRTLARFLRTTGIHVGPGGRNIRKASDREFYVKSLHAWNSWRAGEEELRVLRYHQDAKIPAIK